MNNPTRTRFCCIVIHLLSEYEKNAVPMPTGEKERLKWIRQRIHDSKINRDFLTPIPENAVDGGKAMTELLTGRSCECCGDPISYPLRKYCSKCKLKAYSQRKREEIIRSSEN